MTTRTETRDSLELLIAETLHSYDLIVTRPIVERIRPFGKVIKDVSRIEDRDPRTVVPGYSEMGVTTWGGQHKR